MTGHDEEEEEVATLLHHLSSHPTPAAAAAGCRCGCCPQEWESGLGVLFHSRAEERSLFEAGTAAIADFLRRYTHPSPHTTPAPPPTNGSKRGSRAAATSSSSSPEQGGVTSSPAVSVRYRYPWLEEEEQEVREGR